MKKYLFALLGAVIFIILTSLTLSLVFDMHVNWLYILIAGLIGLIGFGIFTVIYEEIINR